MEVLDQPILVIDETLREGMQHLGIMFSPEQRLTILAFQEKLKIDICQAGYPPAHELEADTVANLVSHAKNKHYKVRIAAMGRACNEDAQILMDTGADDFHFHIHIKNSLTKTSLSHDLERLVQIVDSLKKQHSDSLISIAMLDIGRSDPGQLETCVKTLDPSGIDILSLPDTSGIMAPNQIFKKISMLSKFVSKTKIAIHCHNDLGMANANSVMGILAGGRVLEASVMGIGERNGLADLFVTAHHLKNQGARMRLNTDDIETFETYYTYVDQIVFEQTGHHLLTPNTPFFGEAVKTHVAGTHASGRYGLAAEESVYLNMLCGQGLVKKYLLKKQIHCPDHLTDRLTQMIKEVSYKKNRSLTPTEVLTLIASLTQDG